MLSKVKQSVKTVARPAVQRARPLIDQAALLSAHMGPDRKGLEIIWQDDWTDTFDQALDSFAPPRGCTMEQYRTLLQPTEYTKRHALVLENDTPVALISLRRRNRIWEPVAYQALTGFIAPARDLPTLGRALRATGLDILIGGGLNEDVLQTGASFAHPYEVVRVDLQSDYEAYWELNDRQHYKHVSSARKKCKRMHMVVNDKNDIEWIVNTWRDVWKDSPENETVAAPERINFWNSLPTTSDNPEELTVQVHTLYDGDERAAGAIVTSIDGVQMGQCQVQLKKHRNRGAGTRILDLTLEHSAKAGFKYHDFGGGHGYKSLWGPMDGRRYYAGFRPKLLDRFEWAFDK